MSNCHNIRAAILRHFTPGTFLILMLGVIIFGPRAYDAARGEPWIDNKLAVIQTSNGNVIIEDYTFTRQAVSGLRANTIENDQGHVVCSTEHHNTWKGERNRNWSLDAFTGCTSPPTPFRVCSRFVVSSDSGRTRQYGPFCSNMANEAEGEISP